MLSRRAARLLRRPGRAYPVPGVRPLHCKGFHGPDVPGRGTGCDDGRVSASQAPGPRPIAAPGVGRTAARPAPTGRPDSFYAAVGGHETFVRLVDRFYEGVAEDPLLRPMYPEEDLTGARERLTLFLEQYWGGPTTYSERRGHPRLRMRHAPFPVTPQARDRWLAHMRTAVTSLGLASVHEATLWDYLERAAHSLVNTLPDPPEGVRYLPGAP